MAQAGEDIVISGRKREIIKSHLKSAEEYFEASEMLARRGLLRPAAHCAYKSAQHSTVAAFMTKSQSLTKETYLLFMASFARVNIKVSQFLDRDKGLLSAWDQDPNSYLNENEALQRAFMARELLAEVKDLIKVFK